jgi:hypothetical protein
VVLNERVNLTPVETPKEESSEQTEKPQSTTSSSEFDGLSHKVLQTDKGRSIESDVQFLCVGATVRNELFVNNELFKDKVDPDTGRIKVNQYLQVEGLTNVFCIGDLANTKEHKTFVNAFGHIGKVEKSIPSNCKYNEVYWRFYRNTVEGSFKSLLQYCDRISNTISYTS